MKILIIEDEPELSAVIGSYLSEAGFTCELAPNMDHATEKILVYEYDILLLDIGLPDGNGLDLITK